MGAAPGFPRARRARPLPPPPARAPGADRPAAEGRGAVGPDVGARPESSGARGPRPRPRPWARPPAVSGPGATARPCVEGLPLRVVRVEDGGDEAEVDPRPAEGHAATRGPGLRMGRRRDGDGAPALGLASTVAAKAPSPPAPGSGRAPCTEAPRRPRTRGTPARSDARRSGPSTPVVEVSRRATDAGSPTRTTLALESTPGVPAEGEGHRPRRPHRFVPTGPGDRDREEYDTGSQGRRTSRSGPGRQGHAHRVGTRWVDGSRTTPLLSGRDKTRAHEGPDRE